MYPRTRMASNVFQGAVIGRCSDPKSCPRWLGMFRRGAGGQAERLSRAAWTLNGHTNAVAVIKCCCCGGGVRGDGDGAGEGEDAGAGDGGRASSASATWRDSRTDGP